MWLLLAGATANAVPWTGTLEPRWWALSPGFGAFPEDGTFAALVLRTDDGRDAVYSPGDGDPTPDTSAAACIVSRVTVEGDLVQVDHPFVASVLTKARVVACEPTRGVGVAVTGRACDGGPLLPGPLHDRRIGAPSRCFR